MYKKVSDLLPLLGMMRIIWKSSCRMVRFCLAETSERSGIGRRLQLHVMDSYLVQLELVYCELAGIEILGALSNQQERTLYFVSEALEIVRGGSYSW